MSSYFQEAKERNGRAHAADHGPTFITKPVIGFDSETSAPRWQFRTLTTDEYGCVKATYSLRAPTDNSAGKPIATPRDARFTARDEDLYALANAVMREYRRRPDLINQPKMLHALSRLQVYASQIRLWVAGATDAPRPEPRSAGPAVRSAVPRFALSHEAYSSYRDFLLGLLTQVTQNVRRGPEGANYDLECVTAITGYFRAYALSLRDISDKLATKPWTHDGDWPTLRARLSELAGGGLQELNSRTAPEALHNFLHAFCHASSWFPLHDASPDLADLTAFIGAAVSRLSELQQRDNVPLHDLFMHLARRVLDHGDETLVASLESLLRNPDFQRHAEQLGGHRATELDGALKRLMRGLRAPLSTASAAVLARRPVPHFLAVIETLLESEEASALDHLPLYEVFSRINRSLQGGGAPWALQADKERLLGLVQRLVEKNALYMLAPGSASAEERALITRNLQPLYGLDPAYPDQLDAFFSDAVFSAAQQLAQGKRTRSFAGQSLVGDLVALLQHTAGHPVEDRALFQRLLQGLQDDYVRGLSGLRGGVLRALSGPPRILPAVDGADPTRQPVEAWMRETILPAYERLLHMVLQVYPFALQQEDFSTPKTSENAVILGESGGLYVARSEAGRSQLTELLGRGHASVRPEVDQNYYRACNLRTFLSDADALAARPGVPKALRKLASHFGDFGLLSLDSEKTRRMDALLQKLFARFNLGITQGRSASPARGLAAEDAPVFEQRLTTLAQFFRSVAPFRQHLLEGEAERRFFRNHGQNREITRHGRAFIGEDRAQGMDGDALRAAVVDKLFEVGHRAVDKVIESCADGTSLHTAVARIETLVRREIDLQSFNTDLMVGAFNQRHGEAMGGASAVILDATRVEALRQDLYKESEATLKNLKVDYIMPNQALAMELCRRKDLEDENLLLKMGTGQGKSVVIAATALKEAGRLREGEMVFVLTGYDHLARGDHKLGRQFFAPAGIESACITSEADLDKITGKTQIIYADAKTLQGITQQVLKKQVRRALGSRDDADTDQANRLAFLKKVYAGNHRFILDEYDLVLNDLDFTRGFVSAFSPSLLNPEALRQQTDLAPRLANSALKTEVLSSGVDPLDGKKSGLTNGPYLSTNHGAPYYKLRTGALRVSMLLAKAKRVIGLSGSTQGSNFSQVVGLEGKQAKYFEIPSSRDPDSFGTRIVGAREELGGLPGIWRASESQVIAAGDENAYIEAIVKDVQAARRPRPIPGAHGEHTVRPVLIFADSKNLALRARLVTALQEAGLCPEVKDEAKDLEDPQVLDAMGLPGSVTVTSILCGRGVDINVSLNVPDSMHIVVGVNLATERLWTQVLGRTGRMGRDGTYSEITFGPCVSGEGLDASYAQRCAENALHELTSDFIDTLRSGATPAQAQRWLALASELGWYPESALQTFAEKRGQALA